MLNSMKLYGNELGINRYLKRERPIFCQEQVLLQPHALEPRFGMKRCTELGRRSCIR